MDRFRRLTGTLMLLSALNTPRSPKCMTPVSGVSSPAMHRSSVDLPHPDGPSTATNSPGSIDKELDSSPVPSGNRQLTLESVRPTPELDSLYIERNQSYEMSSRPGGGGIAKLRSSHRPTAISQIMEAI